MKVLQESGAESEWWYTFSVAYWLTISAAFSQVRNVMICQYLGPRRVQSERHRRKRKGWWRAKEGMVSWFTPIQYNIVNVDVWSLGILFPPPPSLLIFFPIFFSSFCTEDCSTFCLTTGSSMTIIFVIELPALLR